MAGFRRNPVLVERDEFLDALDEVLTGECLCEIANFDGMNQISLGATGGMSRRWIARPMTHWEC